MNDGPEEVFPQHAACPGAVKIPTEKEEKAFSEMRRIKRQVRFLKERLKGEGEFCSAEDAQMAQEGLASLREEWDEWKRKLEAAATERMRLLGHEQEPPS